MDFNQYREAYASLGEEKYQVVEVDDDIEIGNESQMNLNDKVVFLSAEEAFFYTRKEVNWSQCPGHFK